MANCTKQIGWSKAVATPVPTIATDSGDGSGTITNPDGSVVTICTKCTEAVTYTWAETNPVDSDGIVVWTGTPSDGSAVQTITLAEPTTDTDTFATVNDSTVTDAMGNSVTVPAGSSFNSATGQITTSDGAVVDLMVDTDRVNQLTLNADGSVTSQVVDINGDPVGPAVIIPAPTEYVVASGEGVTVVQTTGASGETVFTVAVDKDWLCTEVTACLNVAPTVDLSANAAEGVSPVTLTGATADSDGTVVSEVWSILSATNNTDASITQAGVLTATQTDTEVDTVITYQLCATDDVGAETCETRTYTIPGVVVPDHTTTISRIRNLNLYSPGPACSFAGTVGAEDFVGCQCFDFEVQVDVGTGGLTPTVTLSQTGGYPTTIDLASASVSGQFWTVDVTPPCGVSGVITATFEATGTDTFGNAFTTPAVLLRMRA